MNQLDIFTQEETNPLPIHNSWYRLLGKEVIYKAKAVFDLTNKYREQGKTVFPVKENVFVALKYPVEHTKVVILGQDPYHNGNATGLAFACNHTVSPSLRQILQAINRQYKRSDNRTDLDLMTLKYLQKQGVLLLNTCLTVEQGKPNSHSGIGWEDFTSKIVERLSYTGKGNIFLLWGKHAKAYKKYIRPNYNLILEASHPVSASYNNSTWKCDHFKLTNEYLKSKGKTEITWI